MKRQVFMLVLIGIQGIIIISLLSRCTKAGGEPEFELPPEYDYWYSGSELDSALVKKDWVAIWVDSEQTASRIKENPVFKTWTQPGFRPFYAEIDPFKTTIDDLVLIPGVEDIVYLLERDYIWLIPQGKIYLKCKTLQTTEQMLNQAELDESVQRIEPANIPGLWLITFSAPNGETLRIARKLYETGLCDWAEPNFIRLISLHPNK